MSNLCFAAADRIPESCRLEAAREFEEREKLLAAPGRAGRLPANPGASLKVARRARSPGDVFLQVGR